MGHVLDSTATIEPSRRPFLLNILSWVWKFFKRLIRVLKWLVFGTVLVFLGVLFINFGVLSTSQFRAYRDLDPNVPACREGLAKGWTILADVGRERLRTAAETDDADGWADPSDDETAVVARDSKWSALLRCSLQRHIIPAESVAAKPLEYYLGFLEFQENGEPYALVAKGAGGDTDVNSSMLQHAIESEMLEHHTAATVVKPIITQLDVLKQHLSTGSNYVIVFIHGWRHDARIGDQNVADLRLYAAHAARFLAQRCPIEPQYCDMKVTAIYVGWRGARVDEEGLLHYFGKSVGGFFGTLSAAATLFDRKLVSERIAPGAISALRTLESVLAPDTSGDTIKTGSKHNKMVVAGHSLGGNMLATGLKDDLIKLVRRHKFGENLPPVLGNLVVLINPAAEATKWTAIQREVWDRTAYHVDEHTPSPEVVRESGFFPANQRPVLVSVTAAIGFRPGGLRSGDCAWIGLDTDDKFKSARQQIRNQVANSDSMFDSGIDYDWASHDLFPTFKFDFRPAAAYFDMLSARIEGRHPQGESCTTTKPPTFFARLKSLPTRILSFVGESTPFQNPSWEDSHTIGNLDPPRPAAGNLADALTSSAPFGTTHELLGLNAEREDHNPYATLADADIDCPPANHWLIRARAKQKDQYGIFWDSENLVPPTAGSVGEGKPAAQFLHGFDLSGTAPITRANDPFWNMRAFDNALSRHDGYRLTSFICAMNQLVMDDITDAPSLITNSITDPIRPMTGAVP